MESEVNLIMYHISRSDHWKIGDVLICGEKENPFWRKCKDFSPEVRIDDQKMSLFEMFEKVKGFSAVQQNISFLLENLKLISKECAFYIREQAFEDVRQRRYPELPSRKTCLWVTAADGVEYWKTIVTTGQRFLLQLELKGKLFCGDDHWLEIDTLSSVKYAERAEHYWAGEMSSQPNKEYLFSGRAIVKNVSAL